MRAIGSDPRRAHGLVPVMVIADEPAQWPVNDGQRIYTTLMTALGKHQLSRCIARSAPYAGSVGGMSLSA